MTNARKEKAENAKNRAQVYGLLAAIFRAEPGEAFIEELKTPEFSQVLTTMGLSLGDGFYAVPSRKLVEDLGVEYARLFIGPGPHLSPHESVFANTECDEGGLWGKTTVKVKKFIETAGFDYEENFTGLPDHLGVELEFMQKLAEWEAYQWAAGEDEYAQWSLSIQKKFIDEHLSKWVPEFSDEVIKRAETPFYGEFAKITKNFLEFEKSCHEQPC